MSEKRMSEKRKRTGTTDSTTDSTAYTKYTGSKKKRRNEACDSQRIQDNLSLIGDEIKAIRSALSSITDDLVGHTSVIEDLKYGPKSSTFHDQIQITKKAMNELSDNTTTLQTNIVRLNKEIAKKKDKVSSFLFSLDRLEEAYRPNTDWKKY